MANTTQLRLNQITGSVELFKPTAVAQGLAANAFVAGDLSGSLGYLAQAITNIHGSVEYGNQVPGTISFADGTNVDVKLVNNDTGQKIHLDAKGLGADAIDIDSDGGVQIDADGALSIDSAGGASNISHTATANGDFTIEMDASVDASLILKSTGTAADALQIETTAGGIDITNAGAAGGEDLNLLSTNASIELEAREAARDAIKLFAPEAQSGVQVIVDDGDGIASIQNESNDLHMKLVSNSTAGSEVIQLVNTNGDTDGSDDAGAIELSAAAGGIGLAWNDAKDLWAEGGRAIVVANENAAEAIKLHADAGNAQTIVLQVDESVVDGAEGAGSVLLSSTLGGIGIRANDSKDIWVEGGRTVLTANENAGSAIKLHADAGDAQTIVLQNDAGEVDGSDGAGSVLLAADAGGIGLAWSDSKSLWAEGGDMFFVANENPGSPSPVIKLHADAGANQTIALINDQGTDAMAIEFTATAGGIKADAAKKIELEASEAGAQAILLDATDAAGQVHVSVGGSDKQVVKATVVELNGVDLDFMTDGKGINLGSDDSFQIKHDAGVAATPTHQVTTGEFLGLTGSSGVTIGGGYCLLSGSGVIAFKGAGIGGRASDGGTTFNFAGAPDANSLLLTDTSATATYKTNFCSSGDVSILGALNALKSSVSATDPTLLVSTLTGSNDARIVAGVPVGVMPASIPSGGGTASKFNSGPMADITPAKIEVFVNGQQLLSGSEAARAGGLADYHVNSPGFITFAFDIVKDDVILVRDRT